MSKGNNQKGLRAQVEELQARLAEAEEVLRAIRNGEVDALVVSGEDGEQIFTLQTAERPYRLLIEAMNEGAVTLSSDGTILYCNQRFADMLGLPLERVLGADFPHFIARNDLPLFEALLRQGRDRNSKGEVKLLHGEGHHVPAHLSLSALPLDEVQGVSIVVTDLTEQKRHAEMIASANLTRSILEQAAEAMVVCDAQGRIIHASQRAHKLCNRNLMLQPFDEVFPLSLAPAPTPPSPSGEEHGGGGKLSFSEMRREKELQGVEVIFRRADGETFDLLLSAGAVSDGDGGTLGWVVNLTSITELKQAEHERERLLVRERAARQEAEESSRLKDEFLATVSHELRTPLTAVLGWAHLLRGRQLDERAAAHALETIERNARSQNQLIEDLLDVSRIITGNLRLDVRPVNPASFIESAIEAVRPAAEAKGIRLQKLLDTGVSSVSGDPARLQQIIWNLLSNAIKFTPKGGRVQVRLERINSHIEVSVSDNGDGISAEFLPFVFDRFRQADGTTTRRHGGLGLGLSIVRHLVELHGGTVSVESPGEGQGSMFTVRLLLMPVYHREEGAERVHPAARDAPLDFECPGDLSGLTVLVVDDEADTLELIKVSLGQCGAEVMTARSSAEALALLEGTKPDVIVSDIGMPDEDGYEFIRRVRALPVKRGGKIPAVALTAYARAEDRLRVLRSGYQMHVAKPVELAELVAIVANVVGRT
ncbi:MAG TPA: ATP-binding protein [Pyrinomonadaceae bacterium]